MTCSPETGKRQPAAGPHPRRPPGPPRDGRSQDQGKGKGFIYAERRNGGHPRAHNAALTRPCPHPLPALQTQANVKVKDKAKGKNKSDMP
jgi:hypothetical protein